MLLLKRKKKMNREEFRSWCLTLEMMLLKEPLRDVEEPVDSHRPVSAGIDFAVVLWLVGGSLMAIQSQVGRKLLHLYYTQA